MASLRPNSLNKASWPLVAGALASALLLLLAFNHYNGNPLLGGAPADPNARFYYNVHTRLAKFYQTALQFQAVVDKAADGRGNVIGNVAWYRHQVMAYGTAAVNDTVKTICEIGFGAGHSTLLWHYMNPSASIYTFDVFGTLHPENKWWPTQKVAIKFIEQRVRPRNWVRLPGDSNASFHAFYATHPKFVCDLVHIDGSHDPPLPLWDMRNFRKLSGCHTMVLLDDMNSGPGEDYRKALQEGLMTELDCVSEKATDPSFGYPPKMDKVFCLAKYQIPGCV